MLLQPSQCPTKRNLVRIISLLQTIRPPKIRRIPHHIPSMATNINRTSTAKGLIDPAIAIIVRWVAAIPVPIIVDRREPGADNGDVLPDPGAEVGGYTIVDVHLRAGNQLLFTHHIILLALGDR